jgi:TonB family protein
MNCEELAAILDERGEPRLRAAERCAVDEHLASCADCSAAWHAQSVLQSLAIPVTPANLLGYVLSLREVPARRRVPRAALGAAIFAAGAALAAVTYVQLSEHSSPEPAAARFAPEIRTAPANAPAGNAGELAPTAEASSRSGPQAAAAGPDSDYFLVARTPPEYPSAAIERGIEGHVQLKFTVTQDGSVTDIEIVEASDPLFGPAAVAALAKWRYLPRVAGGRRVTAPEQRTIVRFQLAPAAPPPPTERPAAAPLPNAVRQAIEQRVDAAWKCASGYELRCAELILDEVVATYDLDADETPQIWTFYGWIFTQYGDYGRAIAAYEQSVGRRGWPGEWVALANLYFARNQYDLALETLLRGKAESSRGQMPAGAEPLLEKLRALGITEDVL